MLTPRTVLSDTYGDCTVEDLDGGFPATRKDYVDDYEYDSDSDFEEDIEAYDIDNEIDVANCPPSGSNAQQGPPVESSESSSGKLKDDGDEGVLVSLIYHRPRN